MALIFPAPAQIKNLQDPTDPQDAATKNYVDAQKTDPTKLVNGTSNVAINTINGVVTTSVGGVDNVVTVSSTGTTVKGTENITGNLVSSGNIHLGLPGSTVYLGNTSNIKVYGGTTGQVLKLISAASSTTVSGAVLSTDVIINVAGTIGFPPTGGYIIIDSEVIQYTGTTSTSFTGCTRGLFNSVPAAHGTSTVVYNYSGGTIGWDASSSNTIFNGTSNINIASSSAPITASVNGNANIVVITGTGANINGYANINAGTLTSSNPVSITQTWNNAAVTFTGILENITDTASATNSKLIDLQVGGTSKFNIDKSGNLTVGTGSGGTLTGLNGLTLNSMTVTGSQTGNANVSTVTGNLGLRAISSTYTDSVALASATIANAAAHAIDAPTLAASNTGVTFTNASTLYIANAPIAGTNATLTNKYALYVANGNSYFNSSIVSGVATGTAPFVINSTTKVANLYANASDFSNTTVATTGVYYPTLVGSSSAGLQQEYINSSFSMNVATGTFLANNVNVSSQLISTLADGTAPLVVTSKTVVTNLHANLSDYNTITSATTGTYYPTIVSSTTTGAQQEYVTSKVSIDAATGNLTTSGSLISSVSIGTAPLNVTSTTRVANLNVAYANVSDFGVVTTQTTGTYYPVFVNGSTTGNYALASNTNLSFDSATGQLNVGKLSLGSDLTVSGNLTVTGTTTTINATTTRLVDPLMELGGGVNGTALTSADGKDRGLVLHYATGTAGQLSYRVGFNGTNQSVTTPANANFALPGDFTIEAYVNPTNFTNASVLFSQGASSTASPFSFGIGTDGKPYISFGIVYGTTGEGGTASYTAPTGTTFTSILFTTYGRPPDGTAPNYVASSLGNVAPISTTTAAVATAFLGKTGTQSIVANTTNLAGGIDPWGGNTKTFGTVLSFGSIATTALTAGTWSHVAVTRIGSTVTIYINGAASGSTTYATSIGSGTIATNTFGASYQSAGVNTLYYNGSISNFRLIKGQGIYTGPFTLGYTPLSTTSVGSTGSVVGSISGTVAVLTFQSSTIVDNSTVPITLTPVSSPTVDQNGFTMAGTNYITSDGFIGYKPSTSEFIFANNISVTNEVVTPISYGNVRGNSFIANSFVGNSLIASTGSIISNTPAIQLSQTWNNSSVAFTGIYTNFTDTTSSSSSKLIDIQVNNNSKFTVDKAGNLTITGTFSAPSLATTITTGPQPYITSVGSLSGLTVSNATGTVDVTNTALVRLGAVGNLKITGGTPGQVLTTDGSGGLSFSTVPTATFYVGTTALTTNRTSASQALTGITSIDGSAAKLTTPRTINGISFDGSADITVPLSTTGSITASSITASALSVTGFSTLQGVSEVLTILGVAGTYNCSTGTIFYHGAGTISGNFVASLTNVPGVGAGITRVVSVTIVVAQSTSPGIPYWLNVNGTTYSIKWYNGVQPTGTASAVDYFTFSIFISNGAVIQVTGTAASYY